MVKSILFTPFVALATTLSCPETKVINQTKEWNAKDQQTKAFAEDRCKDIYKGFPCLIQFKKVEEGVYSVLCGKKR